MKKLIKYPILIMLSILFVGCQSKEISGGNEDREYTTTTESGGQLENGTENLINVNEKEETQPEVLNFVDVFGEEYQVEIDEKIPKHSYDRELFIHDGHKLYYEDEVFVSRLGVDVSHHQGNINWNNVKADGYEFAFLRIGYRGYGKKGIISADKQFANNIKGAQAAGLDVGVYFFAQAINEEEALEEARFVIEHLEGHDLQLPVVYDPESILDAPARTDDVSKEQFTANAKTFCDAIKAAGYSVAVYSNMLWEAYMLDLKALPDIPIWYADYEPTPQTPYNFVYWQYSDSGAVDGVPGRCDIDVEMIKKF